MAIEADIPYSSVTVIAFEPAREAVYITELPLPLMLPAEESLTDQLYGATPPETVTVHTVDVEFRLLGDAVSVSVYESDVCVTVATPSLPYWSFALMVLLPFFPVLLYTALFAVLAVIEPSEPSLTLHSIG